MWSQPASIEEIVGICGRLASAPPPIGSTEADRGVSVWLNAASYGADPTLVLITLVFATVVGLAVSR